MNEASTIIQNAAHEDANIIFGAVMDEKMGDELKLTGHPQPASATTSRTAASACWQKPRCQRRRSLWSEPRNRDASGTVTHTASHTASHAATSNVGAVPQAARFASEVEAEQKALQEPQREEAGLETQHEIAVTPAPPVDTTHQAEIVERLEEHQPRHEEGTLVPVKASGVRR